MQQTIESQPITFDVTFKQVPNESNGYVKGLKKKLKRNNGHCISQPVRSPDTKCPCRLYREEGECLCGMYIKVPVYEEDENNESDCDL